MLHLLDMKSIRMFFQMYLLLAVLVQKGLKLRSEEVTNVSVCYSPWLLDASYCGLNICRTGSGHPAGSGDVLLTRCFVLILVPVSLNKLPASEK